MWGYKAYKRLKVQIFSSIMSTIFADTWDKLTVKIAIKVQSGDAKCNLGSSPSRPTGI